MVSVTVDTTAPAAPTVSQLSTTDTTPVISGTATLGAGEQLSVTVNGATYNNVNVAGGVWSIDTGTVTPSSGTLGALIPGGTYSITATLTDTAGNTTSDVTNNELVITFAVPTTIATITDVTEATANSLSSTSLTLSGTLSAVLVAGEVVKVYDGTTFLGNATVVSTGSGATWSYSNVSTTSGSHTFNVEVANATGHSATSSASLVAGTTGNNSGNTALSGTSNGEYIFGFAGSDTINGFSGSDTVNGGAGTDTILLATTSADLNNATDAKIRNLEVVSAAGAAAAVTIDLHNQAEGFTITGSGNADIITGSAAADTINAGGGSDTINGYSGIDTINGGAGTDTILLGTTLVNLNNATDGQILNVETVSAVGAAAPVTIDVHNQTEALTITGSGNADTLTGGFGVDTIVGGAGGDILTGGAGGDKMNGGADGDIFIGGTGAETIDVGVFNDNVQDRVQFFNATEFGDTVSSFDSTGSVGELDLIDFGGALTPAFDDMSSADGTIAWITGNGVNGGNSNADLNTTGEALYLAGTNSEGVLDKDLTRATVVANEFDAEFNITANSGQDALLVVNATNSNNFAVYSYVENGSAAEIQAAELTLIGVFNSNGDVGTNQFNFI